jgi:CubicO group peptidase (beta-lactamase class C family)
MLQNQWMCRTGAWVVLLTLLLATSRSSAADDVAALSCPQTRSAGQPRYEEFFDKLIAYQLAKHRIPGAVVSFVAAGRIAFAKGYGVADMDTQRPVDADTTGFRIASITKVFTWLAALQLVEQGRIDLHTDVNQYLGDLQLPNTYVESITLADLMTHSAGLEDGFIGTGARNAADVVPLEVYLERRRSARVRPPGQASAYSNYGAALAGRIVEVVADETYDEVLEKRILLPLGMQRTTAREPLPPQLAAELASSYRLVDGELRVQPFIFDVARPDGSISSTGADMARFMIALMQLGRAGEGRILREETMRLMLSRQFAHHPKLLGLSYGLFEGRLNQVPIFQHSGGWEGFISWLGLVPARNLGVFVSYNSRGGAAAYRELRSAFADCYFPAQPPPGLSPGADLIAHTPKFAGEYRPTRGQYANVLRFSRQLMSERVEVIGPGTLAFDGTTWIAEGPALFRAEDKWSRVAFREEANGQPAYMFSGNIAFERVPWFETTRAQLALIGTCMAVFILAVGAGALRLIRRKKARGPEPSWLAWARRIAIAASIADLTYLAVAAMTDVSDMVYGVMPAVYVAVAWSWICAGFAVATLIAALALWRTRSWTVGARIRYTAVVTAQLGFLTFLATWHLWPIAL